MLSLTRASATLTLWLHGFPAFGLPGAASWNEQRDARLFDDAETVFVVIEADKGGEATMRWLARSRIAHRARLVRMPVGIKDPSALYLSDRAGFRDAFRKLLDAAEPFQAADAKSTQQSTQDGGDRPDLIVCDSDLPSTARKLRDLLAADTYLFDRGLPVKLIRDTVSRVIIARPLTIAGVVHEAHRVARPIKLKQQDEAIAEVPVTLPNRVASLYLDMQGAWSLRVLNGITTAPILLDDGSIVERSGYDERTGLRCAAVQIPPMPPMVPMPLAVAALLRLRATFRTFPFADAARIWDATLGVEVVDIYEPSGYDESAFLIGLMTAVCRPNLWLAPGLLLVAPQISGAGTGKGLLARAICMIAFGQLPHPFTAGHDREELEKRIATALIEGRQELFLDNANDMFLRSATLASAMTERPAQVREFGKLRMLLINLTTFVIVTGNALSVAGDLARRFLMVELDARMEDPEERPFPPGFLASIEQRRPEILADILTIWRFGRQNPGELSRP